MGNDDDLPRRRMALNLWIFSWADSSPAEKEWARTIFTAITSAAAGILFGKQLGK